MQDQSPFFPIIAIAGSPRVGSMWSFNVARTLVREAGLEVVPHHVLKTESEWLAAAELYLKSRATDTRCVIKVHTVLSASPRVKVIRNKRDLRDRLFSYFQFTNLSFDEERIAAEVVKNLEVDSHYDQWPAERILNIPFESIETNGIELIRRITEFVGLPAVNAQTLRKIDFQFSKQQVRKQIAELENRVFDRDGNVKLDANPESVIRGIDYSRAIDPDSGFQSGHVTDYRSGDWKRLWTDRQKQMVEDAIRTAQ